MRCYIQLTALGDQLNLLPLLWEDAQQGNRPALMVNAEYAGHFDGCSYFDTFAFTGNSFEILTALNSAREKFDDIKVCQVVGPRDVVLEHVYKASGINKTVTDSFQQESWRLAGRTQADWYRQPPLVFDQRNPEREQTLIESLDLNPNKKVMLVAAQGKTSPFPHADLLLELLTLRYSRQFNVVDLSGVKAERIYDLIGVYEKAHVLVAIDSSPLHLAHACPKLPVVALVRDTPSYWHGSMWRPEHIAHIRYGDFTARWSDMFNAINQLKKPGSYFA